MKTIDYEISYDKNNQIDPYFSNQYNVENILFFDIETTGFIAKNSTLYLIGVLWIKNDFIHVRQWFNDTGKDEKQIIESFMSFCNTYTHLIHYNGLGFDLPYIKQKCELLQLSYSLDNKLSHLDIYKEIRCFKKLFHLEHMKLTDIENFLNLKRKDTYSGKELIPIYQKYVTKPSKDQEDTLLLHNFEDITGMIHIIPILNYKFLFKDTPIENISFSQTNTNLCIHCFFDNCLQLPKRLSYSKDGIYINAMDNKLLLELPVYQGTLRYFYNDYQNYYYLPFEDEAIHKSIATYVEKTNKQKATPKTCYTKITDTFIPCKKNSYQKEFSHEYNDSTRYITLDMLLQDKKEQQIQYIKNTLQTFL